MKIIVEPRSSLAVSPCEQKNGLFKSRTFLEARTNTVLKKKESGRGLVNCCCSLYGEFETRTTLNKTSLRNYCFFLKNRRNSEFLESQSHRGRFFLISVGMPKVVNSPFALPKKVILTLQIIYSARCNSIYRSA